MKKVSLLVALILSVWLITSATVHAVGYISYVGLLTTNEDRNSDTSNKINAISGEVVNFLIVAQDADGSDGLISSSPNLETVGNLEGQEMKITKNIAGSWPESQDIMHFSVTIPTVSPENQVCNDIVLRLTTTISTAHSQTTTVIRERTIRACSIIFPTPPITVTPTPTTQPTNTPTPSSSPSSPSPSETSSPSSSFGGDVTPTPNPIRKMDDAIASAIGQPVSSPVTTATAAVATTVAAVSIINLLPVVASASTQSIFSLGNFFSGIYLRKKRKSNGKFAFGIYLKKTEKTDHWIKVVDSITGKGIGGAMIQVRTPDGKVRTIWRTDDKTGSTGDLLPPGEYELVVTKEGWRFPSYIQPIFAKHINDIIYRRGIIEVDQDGKVTVKGDKNEQ